MCNDAFDGKQPIRPIILFERFTAIMDDPWKSIEDVRHIAYILSLDFAFIGILYTIDDNTKMSSNILKIK